jgi:broad specificity phosphatase PhoE
VLSDSQNAAPLHVRVLRHGQASAMAENYDQLSALGFDQSARAGKWLAAHKVPFCAVYVGAMQRHAQTLAAIQTAYQRADLSLPIACVLPQLNEYDFRAVFAAYRQHFADDKNIKDGRWLMVLRAALVAWSRAQISAPGLESWADFQIRVSDAAKTIARTSSAQESKRAEVLVVTSGGVMGLLTQRAMGLEDITVADVNMALKNTSFCDFRVSKTGWSLQALNNVPHLSAPEDAGLHTYI